MAKRKSVSSSPSPFVEPTPMDEFKWSMDRVVEKAVLMHPQTQKLRKTIEKNMQKAAKTATKPAKKGK